MTPIRLSVMIPQIASSLLIAFALNTSVLMAEPRIDYDLDDDGLIEINDLQDLNEIRNNLNENNELSGETLYGVTDGCPQDGCHGYELSRDLNFDTNGNHVLDEGDTYWNEGLGWLPIGFGPYKFTSEFNGNGYTLHNLVIRRPGEGFVGLFSYSSEAHFHDFSLLADIIAGHNSGGVVGFSWQVRFENLNIDVVFNADNGGVDCAVNICGPEHVGGVVGSSNNSAFNNIQVNAQVMGINNPSTPGVLGGMAGSISEGSVEEVAVTGSVTGSTSIGGLAGYVTDSDIQSTVAITQLNGTSAVGGLIGHAAKTTLNNVLLSGSLITGTGKNKEASGGGVIGLADSEVNIAGVISLMSLQNDPQEQHYIGAIIGRTDSSSVSQVYWASDLALKEQMYGISNVTGPTQTFDLTDIQCASDSSACNGLQFLNFSEQTNHVQQSLWDFGSNEEAPVMILASGTYGDRDGNGEMDSPMAKRQAQASDSSSGLGGLFYMVLLLMPLVLRRR